jgi:hypothetical protein
VKWENLQILNFEHKERPGRDAVKARLIRLGYNSSTILIKLFIVSFGPLVMARFTSHTGMSPPGLESAV